MTTDITDLLKSWEEYDRQRRLTDEWKINNMEYDMSQAEWFVAKVRASETYAQNLYAAMCNNRFQKQEVWPVLKDQTWSCSWRGAGGIVADLQGQGQDYMEWYCSGMGEGLGNGDATGTKGYVPEQTVTNEIREDLARLGWQVIEDRHEISR